VRSRLVCIYGPLSYWSQFTFIIWKGAAWTCYKTSQFVLYGRNGVIQVWNNTRVYKWHICDLSHYNLLIHSLADLQSRKRDNRSARILMNAMLLQIKAIMQFFLCPLAVIQLVCVRFRACDLCGDKWKWWRKYPRTCKMCLTPKLPWNRPSCFGYTSDNAATLHLHLKL